MCHVTIHYEDEFCGISLVTLVDIDTHLYLTSSPMSHFLSLWSTKGRRLLQKMAPCDTLVVARHFYPVYYKADSSWRPSNKCIIMNHNMLHHETLANNYMTSLFPFKKTAFKKVRKGVSSTSIGVLHGIHSLTWGI